MENRLMKFDVVKLALYLLKRCWIIFICAEIGFGFMYWRATDRVVDTYTASGTMYVYNANPNLVNYGYASSSDLNTAVQLVNTYLVVIKSNKVLDAVVDRLAPQYPTISAGYIASCIYMGSVSDTGVLRISCRTDQPQKSADICNAIIDVAPNEIIRVVGAGAIEIIDYATPPSGPDARSPLKNSLMGAAFGALPAVAGLVLLFLFNQKIEDTEELTSHYNLSVLASVKRVKGEGTDRSLYILKNDSKMDVIENYAKLRMNMLYSMAGKDKRSVMVVSSISGEGKSTISANLAISIAMTGKKVLLVDADMRRGRQNEMFGFTEKEPGLSEVLIGSCNWRDAVRPISSVESLSLMPTGVYPPNPTELLESPAMTTLMAELEAEYDLVVLDVPPINIISDPLALSHLTTGGIFVVRQGYSDHREVKKALMQAELTGLNLLGFVFYGENLHDEGYYRKGYYYNSYYKAGNVQNSRQEKKKKEKRTRSIRSQDPLEMEEAQNAPNNMDFLRLYQESQIQKQPQTHHTVESRERQTGVRVSEAYRKKYLANRRRRSELYRKKRTPSE